VKSLFADKNYLIEWINDTTLGKYMDLKSPITNVSWFAANDYCKCQGKRLPTIDEWEYVAMANAIVPDARKTKTYNEYILSWYEAPKTYKNKIGETFKNYWGIYDLHGLVWEWTSDFNSVLMSGESRKDASNDSNLFCGSGSLGATDLMNYAAFMRYAFRGSIKAKYSVKNLGFRCVKDLTK
jgi:sulfatase modifying factor 1